jgi:hypothetical protein
MKSPYKVLGMADLYDTNYTNPAYVDECTKGACLGVVSTFPPISPLIPDFDTFLQILFPWCKGGEKNFLQGISFYTDTHWFDAFSRYRNKEFVSMGFKDYLSPRLTDSEISFVESIMMIQRGHGVKAKCFQMLWDLWKREVQRSYWIYNSGQCRYGYSINSRTGKHSFDEELISRRFTELTGDVIHGYETSVCGCGGSKCCNMNKVYIAGKGFFFKDDACRLALIPEEQCRSPKCWQNHG